MKELSFIEQERIRITAYWPKATHDELHVGYGTTKKSLVFESATIIFSLANRVFELFFGPKLKALSPGIRRTSFALIGTLLMLLTISQAKRKGYYQLDEQGRPTIYIGKHPPESIQGHIGLSRTKFLRSLP